MKRPPGGYRYQGAYNSKTDAVKAAGRRAYSIVKQMHGRKAVYYLYVL